MQRYIMCDIPLYGRHKITEGIMGNGQAMVVVVVVTKTIPPVIVVTARPKAARMEARPAVYSGDTGQGGYRWEVKVHWQL